jgi:hypothetical protein
MFGIIEVASIAAIVGSFAIVIYSMRVELKPKYNDDCRRNQFFLQNPTKTFSNFISWQRIILRNSQLAEVELRRNFGEAAGICSQPSMLTSAQNSFFAASFLFSFCLGSNQEVL